MDTDTDGHDDTREGSAGLICGVITGDIVGSSALRADDRPRLLDLMKSAGHEVQGHFGDSIPYPVDIFSGDSWQILVRKPALTLRAALLYRALIRADETIDRLDTRFMVAVGPIDSLAMERVSEGNGWAFRASGRGLSALDRSVRMGFRGEDAGTWPPWDAVARLIDAIVVRQWTPARSRAVAGALCDWTQAEIASRWHPPIRQASVSIHLRGAAWHAIEHALRCFEAPPGQS